jgi:hypothetical protein
MITSFAMAAMTSSGTKPMVYPCLAANRPARGFICSRGLAAALRLGFRAARFWPRLAAINSAAATGRPAVLGLSPGKFSRRAPADYVIIFQKF